MDPEIAAVIERAIGGDEEAREELLRHFEPSVRAAVRRHIGEELRQVVDTDDVVQSTFVAAIADIGELSFRGEAAFRGWLLTIARHRVQMAGRHHRAQRRDVRRRQRLATALPVEAAATGPLEKAERHDEADRVRRAVERLAANDREIIELRSFQGRPFDEIASELGLAGESSARRRFQRALERLAIEMDR
jgi:RNA polymerase sigma-70 factor (ECF subfamily)